MKQFSRIVLAVSLSAAGLLGQTLGAKAAIRIDGNRAMEHARSITAFGPRPSGSAEIAKLRQYLKSALVKSGVKVDEQAFTARTPMGSVPMVNLIAKIPGKSGKRVLLTGHYDTKLFRNLRFVGANDAGSSSALLLELATVLAQSNPIDEIWIVFFDGEEAVRDWSDSDSLYGSRHLAGELLRNGETPSIKAVINLDMIGDRDLNLVSEHNSDPFLLKLAMEVAREQGHPALFDRYPSAIEDDHVPFARMGIRTLNLIDFSYGPGHRFWHTELDTIDKLSPRSFQIVGDVVIGILQRLR